MGPVETGIGSGSVCQSQLIDDVLDPGERTVTWDGTDEAGNVVASGIYLAEFLTTSASARPMVLRNFTRAMKSGSDLESRRISKPARVPSR